MPFDPNDESLDFFQYIPSDEEPPLTSDDQAVSLMDNLPIEVPDAVPEEIAADAIAPANDLSDFFLPEASESEPEPEAEPDPVASILRSIREPDTSLTEYDSDVVFQQLDSKSAESEYDYTPPAQIEEPAAFEFPVPSAEKASPKTDASAKSKSTGKRVAVRKGRPRRKKGEGFLGIPNIIVTGVWCALILLIGLTLGRMMWLCAAEVLAFGKNDVRVTVTIEEGDSIDDIAIKLQREGLIQYRGLFKLYARFAVDDGDIRPGTWELNTKYDYHALVNGMAPSSTHAVVKVTIPEGYSCRQIFALLEEKKVCTARELQDYAATGDLGSYWFLSGVTRGDMYCLEGFLFPDTYEFYTNDSPKNVLCKMLNNFDNKFDDSMIWQIDRLNETLASMMRRNGKSEAFIQENKFDVRKVVIVASLIERETSSSQEGYMISSVIYNRLFNWGTNPAYLNIDATIVYATGGDNENIAANLSIDSPYNTYRYTGLTPGPIANPGLASLKAALEPNSSNYYYYVLDPSVNHHIFATTQAEHDENVRMVNQR